MRVSARLSWEGRMCVCVCVRARLCGRPEQRAKALIPPNKLFTEDPAFAGFTFDEKVWCCVGVP